MSKPYKSSVVYSEVERPKKEQFKMSNFGLDGIFWVLIVALLVLKTFIYIKDEKRDGE